MNKYVQFVLILTALVCSAFLLKFLGIAFFDSQCKTGGCSGQYCSSSPLIHGAITTCEWRPEYGCNKDCKVRFLRCGFDQDFRELCFRCVQDCEQQHNLSSSDADPHVMEYLNACYQACYKSVV